MTEEDQNIAIAEFCGYRHDICNVGINGTKLWGYWRPNGNFSEGTWHLPKYTKSLDAMHGAEEKLPLSEDSKNGLYIEVYPEELARIVGANLDSDNWSETLKMIHATAAQKAEAFLRTIGKWKE